MNKLRELLNRPVTFGLLTKFIISLNVVVLATCWRFAYIGDLEDKEEQEYMEYLEKRVETQEKLIDLLYEYNFGTKFYQ